MTTGSPEAQRGPGVAILGAGPVGLDAALAASERGWPFTLYEAGPAAAAHVRRWGHVQLFSPWSMNASPRMRERLSDRGTDVPSGEECPTGDELVERVLDPVADLPEIGDRLRTGTRVVAVARDGLLKHEAIGDPERGRRPFRLLLEGPDGRERVDRADVVLDCTGTFGQPNALGEGGIPAPGERELGDRIRRHPPDVAGNPEAWRGREVLLVGAGHSAQTAARDLAGLADSGDGCRVHWALRSEDPGWYAVDDDPLPARDRLTSRAAELASDPPPGFRLHRGVTVDRLARSGDRVRVDLRRGDGSVDPLEVDRILSLTGYVGDHTLYRQLQVHECYATAAPMNLAAELLASDATDCLEQESHGAGVLENPEPDFYILGEKSYGRNNTFLMTTGWDQVDSVFDALEDGRGRS